MLTFVNKDSSPLFLSLQHGLQVLDLSQSLRGEVLALVFVDGVQDVLNPLLVGIGPVMATVVLSLHAFSLVRPSNMAAVTELSDVCHQLSGISQHVPCDANVDTVGKSKGSLATPHALHQMVDMVLVQWPLVDGASNQGWAFTTIMSIKDVDAAIAKSSLGHTGGNVSLELVLLLESEQLILLLAEGLQK